MASVKFHRFFKEDRNLVYAFITLSVLTWLDEILDIPHLLLGAPVTLVNTREAAIETLGIVLVGLWLWFAARRDVSASKCADKKLPELKKKLGFSRFDIISKKDRTLVYIFILLTILVWLNEILDIPHLLLNAPITPINSREAAIETLGIVLVGFYVFFTLSRNTSASNLLETELQESQEKFLILSNQSLLSIAILQDGVLKYANKELAKLLGYSLKDILGWGLNEFIKSVYPDDRAMVREQFQEKQEGIEDSIHSIQSIPIPNYEYRMVTKSGTTKWVEIFSKTIFFGGGKAEMITLIDITDKKIAEKTARQQQQQLIQADKLASLGILVSGVAHEINNPNQTIMSYATLITEVWKSLNPILDSYYKENGDFIAGGLNYTEVREEMNIYLEGLIEGARSISSIVGELKEYGRHTDYDRVGNFDINQVVKAAVTLSSNFMKRATRNLKIDLAKNLPRIRGNFQRLEQVLINLIENSCQALVDRRKGLYISTSYNEDKMSVEVKVLDEGIGIPAENITHIQDPFFTTKRNSGGTGLGLAISSRIVEDHDGSLEFYSKPGKGTEAVVTLPVADNRQEGGAA